MARCVETVIIRIASWLGNIS